MPNFANFVIINSKFQKTNFNKPQELLNREFGIWNLNFGIFQIMKSPFVTTFLILLPILLFANTPQSLFEQANDAYTKGQYQLAIEQYETIVAEGNQSTELYYNLGNAYYKTREVGKAVLNLERALLLNPTDADTKYNLSIINEQLPDQLEVVSDFFLKKWWENFHSYFGSTTWGMLTLLSLWMGIAGFILWIIATTRKTKKQGFLGGLGLLLLSILFFFAARSQGNLELHSRKAIVLEEQLDLQNGPDVKSTALLTLHEGVKVELLDQIGDWWKVKLSNGEQGWLPKNALEEI